MIDGAWTWVASLHRLAWSQRVTLVLLVVGGALNVYVATRVWIEPLWRRSYAYKGAVCLLTGTWYVLLVTDVVGPLQFVQVTRWLVPCLVFGLVLSAVQHLSERRQLERRAQLRSQLTDQAHRVIESDEDA